MAAVCMGDGAEELRCSSTPNLLITLNTSRGKMLTRVPGKRNRFLNVDGMGRTCETRLTLTLGLATIECITSISKPPRLLSMERYNKTLYVIVRNVNS